MTTSTAYVDVYFEDASKNYRTSINPDCSPESVKKYFLGQGLEIGDASCTVIGLSVFLQGKEHSFGYKSGEIYARERWFRNGLDTRGYKLAFKGSPWSLYINPEGNVLSIAALFSGHHSSAFGDLNHVKQLIVQGYFKEELNSVTEWGLTMLSGFHSRVLLQDGKYVSVT